MARKRKSKITANEESRKVEGTESAKKKSAGVQEDPKYNEKFDKDDRCAVRKAAENDPAWYAANEQLLVDGFNFPVSNMLGLSIRLDNPEEQPSYGANTRTTTYVPGIYSLDIIPVPGVSQDASSPINYASQKLYSFIRHANAGSTNYNPPDIMMYILAMDNVYCLWNFLARLYGCLNTYNQYNRYMPRYLVEMMNVDFDDMLKHQSDLRALINMFSSSLSTMSVPSVLPYITRHSWLFSNIYCDGQSLKSQIYLYNPHTLYKWVEQTSDPTELPYLEPVAISSHSAKFKFDGIAGLVNEFLNPIISSEDFGVMSGDILKAFGKDHLITVPLVGENYQAPLNYVPEVLMQIENAKQCSGVNGGSTLRITQSNDGYIIFAPTRSYYPAAVVSTHMYNFHFDDVQAKDFAVATRLNYVWDLRGVTTSDPTMRLASCGSELFVGTRIGQGNVNGLTIHGIGSYYTSQDAHVAAWSGTLISSFAHAPLTPYYRRYTENNEVKYEYIGVFNDVENYCILSDDDIMKANNIALLSEFDVPGVASY
nr:MAG: putative capsid protein [Jiangsu picobirnavirus 87]